MMQTYYVKLNFWTSPATIVADSEQEAREEALARYPRCDCCNQATVVEWVRSKL